MSELAFRAMGSGIVVLAPEAPAAALAPVEGWFRAWERRFSRFDADSELSRLNDSPERDVVVSDELWDVLQLSLAAARETEGLVSVGLLNELEASGYDCSFEHLRPSRARPVACSPALELACFDAHRRTVRLPRGLRLDLGGVIKGWAADQAARALEELGPVQINAGGDLALSGVWSISVESPFESGRFDARIQVKGGGVATSGRNHHRWLQDGVERHHLIDPRTGLPAQTDVMSVTAVGPSALVAEVAAKQVFLLGQDDGLRWLEGQPALAAMVITSTDEACCSARWSLCCDA